MRAGLSTGGCYGRMGSAPRRVVQMKEDGRISEDEKDKKWKTKLCACGEKKNTSNVRSQIN